jgi:hypothetical protein
MNDYNRRQILRIAARALAASGVGLALPMIAIGDDELQCDRAAAGLVPNLDAARDLGFVYLRRSSDRNSMKSLARELFGGERIPDAELVRMIAERVRLDFVAGAIVDVGGWQLARTEAELCAIIALDAC